MNETLRGLFYERRPKEQTSLDVFGNQPCRAAIDSCRRDKYG